MEILYFHPDIKIFLDSLPNKVGAKTDRTISLLSIDEYHLSMPYSKKLEDGLYELRISSIQNIRIFYTFYLSQIVLLHAINKKTDRLKGKDLQTARHRLRLLHS